MENNHIDQQFNEASKLSEEPTVFPGFEKVWEKIEEKLDKKEEKKRIIPLWLPYGIAASLMIGLGAFYFMNKKEVAEPLQPVITENKESTVPGNKVDIAKIDSLTKQNIQKEKSIVKPVEKLAINTLPTHTQYPVGFPQKTLPNPLFSEKEKNDTLYSDRKVDYIYSGQRKDTNAVKSIEEVVVMGYSKTVKSKTVSSASTVMIASTDKTSVHAPVAISSLAGSVAGIEVTTGIKKRDEISIRGAKSIDGHSTNPLYIVDGIVLGRESGFLNTLDPKKIKELKVLKGLEATALYGSKANNGVVVVTTNGLSKDEIEKLKKVSSESKEEILKEPEEPEKVLPKAGQLTAGEVNDFSKWDYWKDIAVPTLDQYKNTWKFFPDKRVSVQLANKDRKPVIGEKVKLLDDKKNIIWEAVSDNLGNVELWISPLTDEKSDSEKYYLSDHTGQVISSNLRTFKNGQNLIILDQPCQQKRILDLAFVVDATGSMGDEISYLQSELLDVLKKIEGQLKNTTVRYGSVFYRDQGDEYVTRKFDFSDNAEDLVGFIKKQKAGGGGDTPEAVVEALKVSGDELKWSDGNSTKIMFLILDAPPHHSEQNIKNLYSTIKAAAKKGITIIPLAASDTDKQTEYLMRTFALLTNGTYTFLTDDSGIGNSHIKPTIDSYEVEKLNDLLLRLILQRAVLPECGAGISNDHINKKMEKEIDSQGESKTVLFPNPTKGQIQIKTKKSIEELFVYDLAGKIIMRKEKLPEGKNTIDLTSYPQGIYLVRVHTNDLWETFKVIKN